MGGREDREEAGIVNICVRIKKRSSRGAEGEGGREGGREGGMIPRAGGAHSRKETMLC